MLNGSTFRDLVSGRRRGLVATVMRCALRMAEVPYRIVTSIRNRKYDRDDSAIHRVDVPVISVGNLTLGGTGKTPVVAWLARWFRERNVRVSIVSRGYGAKDGGQNDEAKELEARLPDVPHLQNPDRVAAATVAIDELETQLILLDDGFQHRRIHRDLDIMLVDATEPFGFGHVFPRGTLRESLSGAERADVIAVTKCENANDGHLAEIESRYAEIAPDVPFVRMAQAPIRLLSASGRTEKIESLQGKRVAAFCAIGNPDSFRSTLESVGCELTAFREFPDHHNFSRSDIDSIVDWAGQCDAIVCTHKDLVKVNIDRVGGRPLFALQIELQILQGEESLNQRLENVLASLST